ncbi:MAG: hypothetical protein AB8H79_14785 [Myxococcota bacterium]
MKHTLLISLMALLGCADASPDGCVSNEESVSLRAPTAAGSAEDLIALVEGSEASILTGPSVDAVPLNVTVTWTGDDASWNQRDPAPAPANGPYADAETICADALTIPIEIRFQTEDGTFDETWTTTAQSNSVGSAHTTHAVALESLKGEFSPSVQGYEDVVLEVHIDWTPEGSQGVLRLIALPDDGGGEQSWDVAVWPAR